jgi:hypothetical protein
LRVQVVEALKAKCQNDSVMEVTEDGSWYQTYKEHTVEAMIDRNMTDIDKYLEALKRPRGFYADMSMVRLIPDIICRTLLVYQRKRGVPPAMSGLLRFFELHKIGDDNQMDQLKTCETIVDFEQVF